jgi:hypothetical protein
MRYWHYRQGLPGFMVLLGLVVSLVLVGCNNSGSDTATVNGTVNLTTRNAAALGGLTFTFPDATLFGFPGQSATLEWGDDGTTFTLTTSSGTVLQGSITFGSCTFIQNPPPLRAGEAPFVQTYDPCQVAGRSNGDLEFGESQRGIIILILGSASQTPVASDPTNVIYNVDIGGNITINMNVTPIGII